MNQVRPDPKPASTRKEKRTDESHAWAYAPFAQLPTVLGVPDEQPTGTDALGDYIEFVHHHPIPRQICRKHGTPEWDTRNRQLVTKRRHERHHSRHEPIRRDELPATVFLFLADYPALWPYFDRTYPTAPQRGAISSESSVPGVSG